MNSKTTRGFLATAGALLMAAALALSGASAASAATQPPPTESTVVITKLAQPTAPGAPANGTQQTVTGTPIGAVTFSYSLVTDTQAGGTKDIGTNAGQQAAALLTAADAPTTGVTGTFLQTDGSTGVTTKVLPRGLYVVTETTTPAGVTPAAPFLLAVPLTDPVDRDKWLNAIYVYPKNAKIGATKTVGTESLVVGGDVTWTIASDIPRISNAAGTAFVAPDYFEIQDTLTDAELVLSTTAPPAIVVKAGVTTLAQPQDFSYTPVASGGTTTYPIVFTAQGRAALATAVNVDPSAKVTVTIKTTVKKAAVIANTAKVFPDNQSKTNNKPLTTAPVETKYGSYQLNKKSTLSGATLSGAQFRVYANQADAVAGNANYLKPVNSLGVVQDLWETNAAGTVVIQGLRYSGWAGGTTVAARTAGYQTYYLVEVKALAGHQLLAEPVAFTVDGASATQTTQTITNQANTGAFVLPLTGGSGVALLTGMGIVLLGGVLLVARLRRRAESTQ